MMIMSIVRSIVKTVKKKRLLFAQVSFTLLAFFVMVVLSYLFASNIVNNNLERYAEGMFTFAESRVESDLREARTTVGGFSQTIRTMILQGSSEETLRNYIRGLSEYIQTSETHMPNANNLFGYFETLGDEPVYISGSVDALPEDFDLNERPWYKAAVSADGSVVESEPYVCIFCKTTVVTYSRTIYDDNGRRLGIVAMDIQVDAIGQHITDIALDRGGYGILLDQNLNMISHANPEFIGLNLRNPIIPLSKYADDIEAGVDISQRPLRSWTGEDSIAYVRRLQNGWYLGLMTPRTPFYQSVTDMMIILCVLGAALATTLILILVHIDGAKNKSDAESRQKSAFLANMSHEIRTPMNAIIGMTSIGKTAPDVERKNYCLSKIEDASHHLLGVINDILDMSKIEANKFELSPVEFSFEKMLQRVVNVVNFRVDEKKLRFTVHIDKTIPGNLIGDDQRLAQVVTNLLSNAVKFTPEKGSITLSASLLEQDDDVCTVQIAVADTGIGIDQEQQALLFRAFSQAESSTTRKYGGTGLGLSISKSIVEMMEGEIWLESEYGVGSTFAFKVRLAKSEKEEQKPCSQSPGLCGVRVLAVDTDPEILRFLSEVINEFGLHCDTVSSAGEALKLVDRKGSYDICLLDWNLPDMDGIALASVLTAKFGSPDVTVILMSSAAEWTAIEVAARNAGIEKFLSKPLFPSDVVDAINQVLGITQLKPAEALPDVTGMFKGRHILLAEDVEINREIVLTLLEPTNLNIDCAENGVEAVRMFSETPGKYDMIFMDVQMPRMDGYEATRRIRELDAPNADSIPIIALTANVFREDVERCIDAGMSDHLGKPLDYDKVMEKLYTYLPLRHGVNYSGAAS